MQGKLKQERGAFLALISVWCLFLVGLEDSYHRKGVVCHLYILLELTYTKVRFYSFSLNHGFHLFLYFYFIFWGYTPFQECISV